MNSQLLPNVADEAQVIIWNQYILLSQAKPINKAVKFNPKLDRLKSYLRSIKADLKTDVIGLELAYSLIKDCVTSYKKGWYC